MTNPLDFTARANPVPFAFAAAVLLAGYVVGPLLARVLMARTMRAIDDNLVEFLDVSNQP